MQLNEKLVRNGWSGKSGLYVSMIPTEKSKDRIMNIAEAIGVIPNRDELHCTIMYSPETAPSAMPRKMILNQKGKITGLDLYGETRDTLVITFESEGLQKLHSDLISMGAKHSWPDFKPHVTLSVGQNFDEDMAKQVNDFIKGFPLEFENYSWDDIVED